MEDDDRDRKLWAAAEEGAELMSEGEYQAAIDELTRVIAEDDENHYALFFMGSALLEVGESARALKAFVSALQLEPEYPGALIGAGWALHSLGRYREALRVGKQVLARKKDDPDALYLMGLCHYAQDDKAAALGYLQRFVDTRPEIEVAMEADAIIQILRGQAVRMDEEDDQED
ncbi:MAG TPA: tetratricopeptide repeat protein [Polyangiales bacterium]|nr:tetratricopeptide repeat protein [Polyangiales bacterium]